MMSRGRAEVTAGMSPPLKNSRSESKEALQRSRCSPPSPSHRFLNSRNFPSPLAATTGQGKEKDHPEKLVLGTG
jgi:hypothetical protein